MGIATTGEQAALQRSIHDWAARADLPAVIRAQEARPPAPRGDAAPDGAAGGAVWGRVAELGVLGAGLPERFGGSGLVVDAAVALEAAARELVPGPVLPTALAALLLARFGGPDDEVGELAEGRRTGAVALDAEPGAVPGARPACLVVHPSGGSWGFAEALDVEPVRSFDLSMPAGTVKVEQGGELPGLTTQDVRDFAVTLAAAEAAGVADRALRTAVEYAGVRVQFGRPIGSRQAVKHLCAGMLARREEAVATAWDAARALDEGGPSPAASLAAAIAGATALDAAVENAKDCVQVLGGIGFTWEHDAHLYLRRALGLRQWLGGSAAWRRRVAELTRAGVRRPPALVVEDVDFRARVRAEGLDSERLIAPHWPPPYGLGASAREQLIVDDELRKAGRTPRDLGIGAWAVPTIVRYGTDEQRERFVWPSLRGEITWCQLFSEPEAGSDLASLRTRATKTDTGWEITGQKVWTSGAHDADWAICLARTDPEAPPHQGITYFLVDMGQPGIDIRPLREITGEALFNEVFLDRVGGIPLGEVNHGWKLARGTLAQERVSMGGGSALGRETERLLGLKDVDRLGAERLGALVARAGAVELIGLLGLVRRLAAEDSPPGAESAIVKLLGTRHRQDVAEAAFEVEPDSAELQHSVLLTRCLTIAGGTTQILLNVAAERILGLPRES